MNGYPLKEAYTRMMRHADGRTLQLTPQAMYHHRQKLERGEYPTEATMREMLKKAGWNKVMEERWAK